MLGNRLRAKFGPQTVKFRLSLFSDQAFASIDVVARRWAQGSIADLYLIIGLGVGIGHHHGSARREKVLAIIDEVCVCLSSFITKRTRSRWLFFRPE